MAKEKHYIIENEELMREWDWEKNEEAGLDPEKITVGMEKMVWWICQFGHSWQAIIYNRVRGNKCPYCSNKKFLSGYNDLETLYPELAKEFNEEKNNVKAKAVLAGGDIKYWWKCKKGHNYDVSIKNRIYGIGCPYCTNQKALTGYNDLATLRPDLLQFWDYNKNSLLPTDVLCGGEKKYWWICKNKHSYEQCIKSTIKGIGCPVCANKLIIPGVNDLATFYPTLVDEWDYEKNGKLRPNSVSPHSNKKVFWKCKYGHQWQTNINSRIRDGKVHQCPYCCNQKILKGYNDLEYLYPDIAKEFNQEKNNISACEVGAGSNKKYWWKCATCGHEWKTTISSRTSRRRNRTGCPKCAKERHTSFPEQAIYYYIQQYFPDAINGYRNKENGITELDIYIPSLRIGIEYDGSYWHNYNKKNKYDKNKDIACKDNGIFLYRVKENDKNDANKISIDNNIIYYKYEDKKQLSLVISYLIKCLTTIENINIDVEQDVQKIYGTYMQNKKDNSISVLYPKTSKKWHPIKNDLLTPEMISPGSGKEVWWRCDNGHEYKRPVYAEIKFQSCPYCTNKKLLPGFNDLATKYPELVKEWNFIKNNNLKPNNILSGSHKKVWWKCVKCGYEWQATINNRIKGTGCPCCANKKIIVGINDLQSNYPDIAKQWSNNNDKKPYEISSHSDIKINLICMVCKEEFSKTVNKTVFSYSIHSRVLCGQCGKKQGIINRSNNKNKNDK